MFWTSSFHIYCKIFLQKFSYGILSGLLLLSLLSTLNANAATGVDSLKKDNTFFSGHSPKKAALMSAILPGLGQAYNHKYWKIPVIYIGFTGLSYLAIQNNKWYSESKTAYKNHTGDDAQTIANMGYYHRNRDLSIIACAAVYILNVVDASVDAHLFTFDVSDDLSLNFQPSIYIYSAVHPSIPSLSLTLNFK